MEGRKGRKGGGARSEGREGQEGKGRQPVACAESPASPCTHGQECAKVSSNKLLSAVIVVKQQLCNMLQLKPMTQIKCDLCTASGNTMCCAVGDLYL